MCRIFTGMTALWWHFMTCLIPLMLAAENSTDAPSSKTLITTINSTKATPTNFLSTTEPTEASTDYQRKKEKFTGLPPPPFLEIVFDGQHHVVFEMEKLSLFYNCLCSNDTESCELTIINDTSTGDERKTVENVINYKLKQTEIDSNLSSIFLCRGQFFNDFLRCSRQEIEKDGLFQFHNNTFFDIPLFGPACVVDSVNIGWKDADQLVEIVTERIGKGLLTTSAITINKSFSSESSAPDIGQSTPRAYLSHMESSTQNVKALADKDSSGRTRIFIGLGVGGSAVLIILITIAMCWKCEGHRRLFPANCKLGHNSSHSHGSQENGHVKVSDKLRIIGNIVSEKSVAGRIELEKDVYLNESLQEEEQVSHYVNYKQLQKFFGTQSAKGVIGTAVDEIYGNCSSKDAQVTAVDEIYGNCSLKDAQVTAVDEIYGNSSFKDAQVTTVKEIYGNSSLKDAQVTSVNEIYGNCSLNDAPVTTVNYIYGNCSLKDAPVTTVDEIYGNLRVKDIEETARVENYNNQHRENVHVAVGEEVYGNSAVLNSAEDATINVPLRPTFPGEPVDNRVNDLRPESIYGNVDAYDDEDEYVAVDEISSFQDRGSARLSHNRTVETKDASPRFSQVQEATDNDTVEMHNQPKRLSEPKLLQLKTRRRTDLSINTKNPYTRLSIDRDGLPQLIEDSLDGPYNTASGVFETFIEQKRKTSLAHVSAPNLETAIVDNRISFPTYCPETTEENGITETAQALYFDLEDSVTEEGIYDTERHFGEEEEEYTTSNVYFELEAGVD